MTEHEASRTLVKSPPELWAELSDQRSLSSHLAEPFGEIKITRLEPETAVAWEGERASGTVRIEPSGWGTRVTLTARAAESSRSAPDEPSPAPTPPPVSEPEPLSPSPAESPAAASEEPATPALEPPRRGLLARVRGWFGSKPAVAAPAVEPVVEDNVEPAVEPVVEDKVEPAVEPVVEDKVEPAVEPAVAPAFEPVVAPAAEDKVEPAVEPALDEPVAEPPPTESAESPAIDPSAVLVGVLDRLGSAHRRPFSRP
jgi:hypothetical protein